MSGIPILRLFVLLSLSFALALFGCRLAAPPPAAEPALVEPEATSTVPQPAEAPGVPADIQAFRMELVQALGAGDSERLKSAMADPVFVGVWRSFVGPTTWDKAVQTLLNSQLSPEKDLAIVPDADLAILLSDRDPLSQPEPHPDAVDAFLVTGWGAGGEDEAVLYLSRQSGSSLQWLGWVVFPGGLSRAGKGGVSAYQNDALGLSLFVFAGYTIRQSGEYEISIGAPAVEGAGHPCPHFPPADAGSLLAGHQHDPLHPVRPA